MPRTRFEIALEGFSFYLIGESDIGDKLPRQVFRRIIGFSCIMLVQAPPQISRQTNIALARTGQVFNKLDIEQTSALLR